MLLQYNVLIFCLENCVLYMYDVISMFWQLTVIFFDFRFASCTLQATNSLCSTMLSWFTMDWRPPLHSMKPKTWIKRGIVCCFDSLKLNSEKNTQNHLGGATDIVLVSVDVCSIWNQSLICIFWNVLSKMMNQKQTWIRQTKYKYLIEVIVTLALFMYSIQSTV